MGGCCSMDTLYGNIIISLDKKTYKPKETVKGEIYLKWFRDYPHNEIKLIFIGKEDFIYYIKDKENNLKEEQHKKYIHDNFHVIKTFDTKFIPKGEYKFKFNIQLSESLSQSFEYKYKVENYISNFNIKYYMIAGIFNEENRKNSLLLSEKIQVYIEETNINEIKDIKDKIYVKKLCNSSVLLNGALNVVNQNNLIIYSGKQYDFKLSLNGKNNNIDFKSVNLKLIKKLELFNKSNEKILLEELELFSSNLGNLNSNKSVTFEFKILDSTINKKLSSIENEIIIQKFYFRVDLNNKQKDINYFLIFPIHVLNGKIGNLELDKKFKYYKGNKNAFNDTFNPIEEKEINLNNAFMRNRRSTIKQIGQFLKN